MNNIVSINLDSPEIVELDRVKQLLSLADWNMRVDAICSALQSPMSHELEQKDYPVPSMSLAGKLGHNTISSFIESEKSGLGIEWSEWRQEVRAKILKNKFNIYADIPSEILGQYEDVRRMLNRDPIDAADFHKQIISSIVAKKKHSEDMLNEQITTIKQELSLSKQALSSTESELKTVQNSLANQCIESEKAIASVKSELLSEHKKELDEQRSTLAQNHSLEIRAVTEKLEGERDQLTQQHSVEMKVITEKLERERNQLTQQHSIEMKAVTEKLEREQAQLTQQYSLDMNAIKERLESERAQLIQQHSIEMKAVTERLEGECAEITQKNKDLESTLASLHTQFDKLRQERDRLEALSKSLVEQIASGTPLEDSDDTEAKLLKSEIESLNEELVHYKNLLSESNHQDIEQLHIDIANLTMINKNYAKRVKNLQIKISRMNKKIKSSNRDFWQVFALAVLSIGGAAAYALVI